MTKPNLYLYIPNEFGWALSAPGGTAAMCDMATEDPANPGLRKTCLWGSRNGPYKKTEGGWEESLRKAGTSPALEIVAVPSDAKRTSLDDGNDDGSCNSFG